MLLIKTYIDKSPIHGIGVFASEFIKKGTVIWEFNPLVDIILTPDQFKEFPEVMQEFAEYISIPYPYGADNYCLSLDNGQYMNHSFDPNMGPCPERGVVDIALRDIPKGTEMMVDYSVEDHRTDWAELFKD
jgi:SET domain-containing protein